MESVQIADFDIEVVRKDIKNMHLAVYPPTGRVRLAAPTTTDKEVVRLFAISKLGWIKKHIKNFKQQPRETPREFISGESHYLFGKRYLLTVFEGEGSQRVLIKGTKKLELHVRPNATKLERAIVMREWYRKQLKSQIPELIKKWEKIIGVKSRDWGVKFMRTKWGTCNIEAKRIWLNLELAKKPMICLEYIIAHELIHLLERNHNARFIALINKHMPKWKQHRKTLNNLPISHSDWGYY